jgi:M6 family metalloprotease-like protein
MYRLPLILITSVLMTLSTYSADRSFNCGSTSQNGRCLSISKRSSLSKSGANAQTTSISNYGGRYLTSTGLIKSFVLFIRFSDDNEVTTSWPNALALPPWAQNILNPTYHAAGDYTQNSFSHYICENSYGKLHIYGDVYYVTLPNNEAFYYALSTDANVIRTQIQSDAFNQLALIPGINLSQYDNWTNPTFDFQKNATPDNKVDLCWVILRNFHDDLYNPPISQDMAELYASKTIGGVTIEATSMTNLGSGIGLFSGNWWQASGRNKIINMPLSEIDNDGNHLTIIGTMAHELSHKFFGYNHWGTPNLCASFSNTRSSSHTSPYTVNSGAAAGHYSAYEKRRMNWITASEVREVSTSDASGILLQDVATQTAGVTKLIKIILDADQSIFIENRSMKSNYEARYSPINWGYTLNPGLFCYLIYQENDYLSATPVNVICANGKWSWTITTDGSSATAEFTDKIYKNIPNSTSGYDEREDIHVPGYSQKEFWALYYPINYGGTYGPWYKGDTYIDESHLVGDYRGTKNQTFIVGDVITKWSNGSTNKWNPSLDRFDNTNFGIQIVSNNSTTGEYTLNVVTSNPQNLPPSKPQNVTLSSSTGLPDGNILVQWTGNTEPDISYYEVSRNSTKNTFGWVVVATTSNTSWVDDLFTYSPINGNYTNSYRIRAIDNTGLYSTYSGIAKTKAEKAQKQGIPNDPPITDKVVEPVHEFTADQNFPNPFNPSTRISFGIPQDAPVRLVVYDLVGREVATLVDEFKVAGRYNVSFDASKLSSGMYIYKIQAGKFSTVKKMQVVK